MAAGAPMTAPLPQLWGVLYAEPNSDGERKACSNCRFATTSPARLMLGHGVNLCDILPVPIKPSMVCGYHIESGTQADPKLAGLETVKGGTSCDRCRFYEPDSDTKGHCMAVADESDD